MEYLRRTDFSKLQPGRYELEGDKLFALVQQMNTRLKKGVEFEAHRKYADIHYIVEGAERMGYAHLGALKVTKPYDEAKDCEFLKGKGEFITLAPGMFAVVYPEDAHMPCMAVKEPKPLKKVVMKVRVA